MGFSDILNTIFGPDLTVLAKLEQFEKALQADQHIIEGRLNQMGVDFTNLDQKVSDIGSAITAGLDAVGKEVIETAQLVKDLRDKVAGGIDADAVQAHLDSIAA